MNIFFVWKSDKRIAPRSGSQPQGILSPRRILLSGSMQYLYHLMIRCSRLLGGVCCALANSSLNLATMRAKSAALLGNSKCDSVACVWSRTTDLLHRDIRISRIFPDSIKGSLFRTSAMNALSLIERSSTNTSRHALARDKSIGSAHRVVGGCSVNPSARRCFPVNGVL